MSIDPGSYSIKPHAAKRFMTSARGLRFCSPVSNGHLGTARSRQSRFKIGQAPDILEEFAAVASVGVFRYIVSNKTTPDLQLGQCGGEVVLVPVLVRVGEDKVEGSRQRWNNLVGIAKTCIDIL